MSETISLGLTLTIPSAGEVNYPETFSTTFATPISQHQHTGSGDGAQLVTDSIAANAVTAAKIRFDNNEFFRARNAANSADVDLIKLDTNDQLQFGSGFGQWTAFTPNVRGNGSLNISSPTIDVAEYLRIGRQCWINIRVSTMTATGTPNVAILFDLPITPAEDGSLYGSCANGGGTIGCFGIIDNATTAAQARPEAAASWAVGTPGFRLTGVYKIA